MPPVNRRSISISHEERDLLADVGQMLIHEAKADECFDQARYDLGNDLRMLAQRWDHFEVPPAPPLDVDTTRLYEPETEDIAAQEQLEREDEARRMGTWA